MMVALMGSTSVAVPQETLTDFLADGLNADAGTTNGNGNNGNGNANGNSGNSNNGNGNGNQGKGKTFKESEEDVAFLEEMTAESAAQAGVAGDYEEYSERLAKTLSMLTPAQQARIFN